MERPTRPSDRSSPATWPARPCRAPAPGTTRATPPPARPSPGRTRPSRPPRPRGPSRTPRGLGLEQLQRLVDRIEKSRPAERPEPVDGGLDAGPVGRERADELDVRAEGDHRDPRAFGQAVEEGPHRPLEPVELPPLPH